MFQNHNIFQYHIRFYAPFRKIVFDFSKQYSLREAKAIIKFFIFF